MAKDNGTQILMTCPSCMGHSFKIYFTGDSILVPPNGEVWTVCAICGSYWTGTMELIDGHLKPFEARKECHGKP